MIRKAEQNRKLLCFMLGLIFIMALLSGMTLWKTAAHAYTDKAKNNSNLMIHYIDVGQADCCLIQEDGHNMLIDAGNREDAPKVISYLKNHGVASLDFVVGTHPHEDHIGAMAQVLRKFSAQKIIMPRVVATTETYKDLLQTIQQLGKKITAPVPNASYTLGACTFTILAPNSSNYENLNNYSVVLKLTYQETSFLFEGDAEGVSENEILSKKYDIQANVLKVGHHGSNSSTTAAYLAKVNPQYAIISCGQGNDYGHPHRETLDKLQKMKVTVYRTDLNGSIDCVSNGTTIQFEPEKGLVKKAEPDLKAKNSAAINSSKDVVYITETGKKYHRQDCRTLKEDKIPIPLNQAKQKGYLPCKVCNPPQ